MRAYIKGKDGLEKVIRSKFKALQQHQKNQLNRFQIEKKVFFFGNNMASFRVSFVLIVLIGTTVLVTLRKDNTLMTISMECGRVVSFSCWKFVYMFEWALVKEENVKFIFSKYFRWVRPTSCHAL